MELDRNLELAYRDYINKNFWNVIPMTEEQFRASGFVDVVTLDPNISGEIYMVGIHSDGHVSGYFCPQRQAGCVSPT